MTNFFLYYLSCLNLNPFYGSHKADKILKREVANWIYDVKIGYLVFLRINVDIAGNVFSNIWSKNDFN